jgi:hypothetical protein
MADIKFEYKFPQDYNPLYVNGAYGGFGPKGEMIINFFLERTPVPYAEINDVSPQGVVATATTRREPEDLENIIIRYVSAGIIMSPDTAKRVHAWLGQHLAKLEEIKKDE